MKTPVLLDTNFLIYGLVQGSTESILLKGWYRENRPVLTSSIVWYEFLCGPVSESQIEVIYTFLTDPKIIPFDKETSSRSAKLFYQLGRPRKTRVDVMIATTAILNQVELATANIQDFEPMVPFGLRLLDE